MKQLNLRDVIQFIEENIDVFHQKRYESINKLKIYIWTLLSH